MVIEGQQFQPQQLVDSRAEIHRSRAIHGPCSAALSSASGAGRNP
jgi:hypothetical protein